MDLAFLPAPKPESVALFSTAAVVLSETLKPPCVERRRRRVWDNRRSKHNARAQSTVARPKMLLQNRSLASLLGVYNSCKREQTLAAIVRV